MHPQDQAKKRVAHCKKWRAKPPGYWEKTVDIIIDNRKFDVPTTERARSYMKQQRVRFHLRTPSEGTLPECTKPGRKKNKLNTGAQASVCAGISNGKIVLWEYLPKKWNGEIAAATYKDAIMQALTKTRGVKRSITLCKIMTQQGINQIRPKLLSVSSACNAVPMPTYSPDLKPPDFCLWDAIEERMLANSAEHIETVAAYKKRMRLTAFRLPSSRVASAVRSIPKRMKAVVKAKGHSIPRD